MLAIFSTLKAILDQGSRVVLVGGGLRQAKLVFEYIDTLWRNSPVFRNIVGGGIKSGPKTTVDLCYFNIGRSKIMALPMGDGCLHNDTFIEYNDCFGTIADDQPENPPHDEHIVSINRKVWGNGDLRKTDESYYNGFRKTKKIKTHKGFEIEGTYNHKLKILRNKEIVWCRLDEMVVGDRILVDKSYRWHNGQSAIIQEEAYACGLLIGDGCFTETYKISFATQDKELSEALRPIGPFKQRDWDKIHFDLYGKQTKNHILNKFGMDVNHVRTKDKQFPKEILKSSREVTSAFISGLFDTDGSVQVTTERGGTQIGITFYNTSKRLVEQLQYILLHYGIVATVGSRQRETWNECYELRISGKDVLTFANEIGFRLKRKQDKLLDGIDKKKRVMDQHDDIPGVLLCMINIMENHKIPWGSNKDPGINLSKMKNKKTASRDLVHRFVDKYSFCDDAVVATLEKLADDDIYYDEIVSIEDSECHTYDIHVPETHEYCANGFYSHNSKIRGFRANVIIADEFASIDETIFDIVIRGFGIVSQSPIEEAKKLDLMRRMKAAGIEKEEIEDIMDGEVAVKGNQIIRAGTAYYAFNHFYKAFERQKSIIRSGGDRNRLGEIFNGVHNIPENFDYRDYALIRIPFTHLPPGLLEPKMLADAKASVPRNIFLMEYGAVFVKDSDGFFPRSLIEACTCKISKPVVNPDGQIVFTATCHGERGKRYVMGIDPAAERDNFAVVICEVWPNHSRVVYSWTINKPEFRKRKKRGLTTEEDYYTYCCAKIRDLVRAFEPFRIEMDSQGGGYAISELLRNERLLDPKKGDFTIYETIEQGEPKDTDGKIGRHILHLVQQSSDFNQVSNMAMHKGFETKRLLFPAYDSVQIEAALIAEREAGVEFDTYEDAANEIEELKSEICTIQKTETPSGKERFDTPSVVTGASVEGRQVRGRLRKDRYTALLLCYRHIHDTEVSFVPGVDYNDVAGNFQMVRKKEKEPMYKGRGVGHMKNAQNYVEGRIPYGGVQRNERI